MNVRALDTTGTSRGLLGSDAARTGVHNPEPWNESVFEIVLSCPGG
jgi:hypothetical protein